MKASKWLISVTMALALAVGLTPLPAHARVAPANALGSTAASGLSGAEKLDLSSVKFVYLESDAVAREATQNIVVGLSDDAVTPQYAELDIASGSGAVTTFKLNASTKGAVSFAVPASELSVGTYKVRALRYAAGKHGKGYSVSFADDKSSSYSFKVVASSAQQTAVDAYTIDVGGSYVKTGSIGSALSASGAVPRLKGVSGKPGLSTQGASGFTVVLDPGHGGHDGGATGIGFNEKDVNLKIALYCKAALEKKPGVTVYMTRTDDTYVSLSDRVQFAIRHKADLVVSIHNNAGGGSGSEVIVPRNGAWYYNETYVTGQGLGAEILGKLNALGLGTNGGVYSRDCTNGETYPDGTLSDYYALVDGPRQAGILGIIVEHAFVDNAGDAAFLRSEANLKKLGKADANAIVKYYNSSDAISFLYWGIYDFDYYLSHYSNVKSRFGKNKVGALGYFKKEGMKKGHRGNVLFDASYYRSKYSDLNRAFGDNLALYYQHFLEYGMKEGRQGSADFSPSYYKKHNSDLKRAFGSNWVQYYKHYVEYGMKEGRKGAKAKSSGSDSSSATKIKHATTSYKGIDYSAVYNPTYYAKKNKDVRKWAKSGKKVDGRKLVEHFVEYGMSEGRMSKKGFSLTSYYNANPDLRRAFGSSWAAYYRHYVEYGQKEGRVTKGVDTLKRARTSYKGRKYSAVYKGLYYAEENPDVAKWATLKSHSGKVLDDAALIWHFVEFGMKEGRVAKPSFKVKVYKKNYIDLQNAFGNDLKAYYLHYIDYGKAEGRNAKKSVQQPIMGSPATTVAQMTRRYKAVGKVYPGKTYKRYGAPTIADFCQLVYEEAVDEGVRPEVVFAQAMHETGWLQFGGDVKPDQCNFAGIGTTGGGVAGASFNAYGKKSVRMGLRAQVQHLKAYASTGALKHKKVDPRFSLVKRASAVSVESLGGKWAVSKSYGKTIVKQMRALLKA